MAKPIPPESVAPKPIPRAGLAYLSLVIALGAVVIAVSAWELWLHPVDPKWIVLLCLTLLISSFAIRFPTIRTDVSVSEAFLFFCALWLGPAPATLITAADGMVIYLKKRQSQWLWKKFFFNAAQPALSMFIASNAFFWMAGIEPGGPVHLQQYPAALITFTSLYFLINSGLNAYIVAISTETRLWSVWTQNYFGWVLANYFIAASVAALFINNWNADRQGGFDFFTLGIVALLAVLSYWTFKTSMEKVDEAEKHLQATINSLAMAVDAKDQVTHGHIQRVEAYAVGLAKHVGVTDAKELKAIRAAALLHDIGKLAIPEHILNKPGKLSRAEFETMKDHARIGADILQYIDFPYPVEPIVRYHHERWDGKGYPMGISGRDIPTGARVLSVVDCFDALTSDRPYRRALSEEEALAILKADRDKAYDPFIVDTFERVYRSLVPRDIAVEPRRKTIAEIAAVALDDGDPDANTMTDAGAAVQGAATGTLAIAPATSATPASAAAQTEARVLPILASLHSFSAQALLGEAADELGAQLCRLTPATLCAVYTHDVKTGELVLTHAWGASAQSLRGVRMAIGERLSGWVAANRKTICNSDAALDLAMVEPPPSVVFQSCLSAPLVAGDTLVGVLTLYAEGSQAFNPDDRRLVERTAGPLAHLVKGALELETVQQATEAGALACWPLVDLQDERPRHDDPCNCPVAAVALRIWGVETGAMVSVPRLLITRAAAVLRRDLRVADLLYQDGLTGLVAILPHADGDAARAIARRARTSLLTALSGLGSQVASHVTVSTGVAWAPDDGLLIDDVMDAARMRAGAHDDKVIARGVRSDVA